MREIKYKYEVHENEVWAISSYARKPVIGKAKCHPSDEFDLEKGKAIAEARCDVKVAEKRRKKAQREYEHAKALEARFKAYREEKMDYLINASCKLVQAQDKLTKALNK